MATTTRLPLVVAAFAIRTKTLGRRAPPTRARPLDLRKSLRCMLVSGVVAGLLGYWVDGLLILVTELLSCSVAGHCVCPATQEPSNSSNPSFTVVEIQDSQGSVPPRSPAGRHRRGVT